MSKIKEYSVKVSYTFTGTVLVRAGSKKEAKTIVDTGFGGVNIEVTKSTWLSDHKEEEGIVDWEIDLKSK